MTPPIKGMTSTPYGEDYMAPAWVGFLKFCITEQGCRDLFKADTGIDILGVVTATGIKAQIDKATGYQADAIAKFADWVTVNLWGTEVGK